MMRPMNKMRFVVFGNSLGVLSGIDKTLDINGEPRDNSTVGLDVLVLFYSQVLARGKAEDFLCGLAGFFGGVGFKAPWTD